MQVVAGSGAGQWFPHGFVPEVLELLLATWERLEFPNDVRLEPRITNLFNQAIEDEYTRQDKAWYVHPEIKEADPVTGKEVSRTDIRLYHRDIPGQKLYFALEAKRIHAESGDGTRGGYGEYVGTDGMMCFITGKYSRAARFGGMLAYVMDGDLGRAAQGVANAIRNGASRLKLVADGDYRPSKLMPCHPWNGETQHERSNGSFGMFHLLLAVRRGANGKERDRNI
jgi:hypothetical protein